MTFPGTPDHESHDRFPLPRPLPRAGEGRFVSRMRDFHIKGAGALCRALFAAWVATGERLLVSSTRGATPTDSPAAHPPDRKDWRNPPIAAVPFRCFPLLAHRGAGSAANRAARGDFLPSHSSTIDSDSGAPGSEYSPAHPRTDAEHDPPSRCSAGMPGVGKWWPRSIFPGHSCRRPMLLQGPWPADDAVVGSAQRDRRSPCDDRRTPTWRYPTGRSPGHSPAARMRHHYLPV